jgi:tetratricopeptide (TPR) repeat protein
MWKASREAAMLSCMRAAILLLATSALTLTHLAVLAQDSARSSILQAYQRWSAGQPKAAIGILEPMVLQDEGAFTEEERGVAWDLLGSSYQDMESFDRARQAYGKAIEILRSIPSAQGQYAATLNNLATMEQTLGANESARALSEKARDIYEQIKDPAGIAVASTNLAALAYAEKDFKTARGSLALALQQAQGTTRLKDDDYAAMYAVMSGLALHDGRIPEAISSIQQAIDRWTHAHGPSYFPLSTGYLLRAQALAKSGDYAQALADGQHALAMDEATLGRKSAGYLLAETEYAQILRATGAKEQASRLHNSASTALAELRSRQCNGCTIDASGFR